MTPPLVVLVTAALPLQCQVTATVAPLIADPAAITSYLICQAARQQDTKVLLSGQGGDEVFCGYPWHLAIHLSRYYDRLPKAIRASLEKLLNKLPAAKGGPLTATFRRLRKFNNSASLEFEDRLIGFLSYAYGENLSGLLGVRAHRTRDSGIVVYVNRDLGISIEGHRGVAHGRCDE